MKPSLHRAAHRPNGLNSRVAKGSNPVDAAKAGAVGQGTTYGQSDVVAQVRQRLFDGQRRPGMRQ